MRTPETDKVRLYLANYESLYRAYQAITQVDNKFDAAESLQSFVGGLVDDVFEACDYSVNCATSPQQREQLNSVKILVQSLVGTALCDVDWLELVEDARKD